MKLLQDVTEESQLRQLKITSLKMINGLLALAIVIAYTAFFVWLVTAAIGMIG